LPDALPISLFQLMMNTERYGSCRSIAIFIYCTAHSLFWHVHALACRIHYTYIRLVRHEHIDVIRFESGLFSNIHAGLTHLADGELEHFASVHVQIAALGVIVKVGTAAAFTAELE